MLQNVHNCLDDLRGSQMWRLLCVAEYPSDRCGSVPDDGDLYALEPAPWDMQSCYVDYQRIMGGSIDQPTSLMRGMSFATFYTDRLAGCVCVRCGTRRSGGFS